MASTPKVLKPHTPAFQRAKNLDTIIRAHHEGNCPLCQRAVFDVTAPACWKSVQLVKAAREAVAALSPYEAEAFRDWTAEIQRYEA